MKLTLLLSFLLLAAVGYGQKKTKAPKFDFLSSVTWMGTPVCSGCSSDNSRVAFVSAYAGYKEMTDTVKAVLLLYDSIAHAVPLQQRVWAIRTYPLPKVGQNLKKASDNFENGIITAYLDTDRKTPITFKHIWQTALIEW